MSDQDSDRIAEENARGKWQTEQDSSLHTKLQELYQRADVSNNRIDDPIGEDEFVAQILQAFQEAGYMKVGKVDNEIKTITAYRQFDDDWVFMQGQTFFDRFKAELDKENLNLGGDAELAVAKAVKLCNDAARRAAGIA